MLKKSSVQAATNYSIKMEMSSVSRSAVNGICWSCGLGRECSKNWWLQVRAIAPDRLTPVQVNLEERTGLAGRRTALPCLLFYLVPDTSCCQWLPVSWFTPRQMASGMWNLTLCLERNVVGLLNSGEHDVLITVIIDPNKQGRLNELVLTLILAYLGAFNVVGN